MRPILVVAFVLLSGFAFAQSQQAQERPQPNQQSGSTQQPAAADDRGTNSSPLVVDVVKAKQTPEEAAQIENERRDQSSARWWDIGLSGTQAFFALGLLVIAGLQYGITVKQTRISRTQATIALAQKRVGDKQTIILQGQEASMRDGLAIARDQAAITKQQNEIIETQTKLMQASTRAAEMSALAAIKSFENMDRPWLDVKIKVLQQPRLTVGKPLAIHFKLIITNVGGSAAQHVIFGVGIVADEKAVDAVAETTRVGQSLPTENIRGQVILPTADFIREFILHTDPLATVSTTPTIFGVVRYTHGRATDGSGIPSPKYHTTSFGFVVKAQDNIGSHTKNEDGSETWFWDPEVETSARDFHHAD